MFTELSWWSYVKAVEDRAPDTSRTVSAIYHHSSAHKTDQGPSQGHSQVILIYGQLQREWWISGALFVESTEAPHRGTRAGQSAAKSDNCYHILGVVGVVASATADSYSVPRGTGACLGAEAPRVTTMRMASARPVSLLTLTSKVISDERGFRQRTIHLLILD